MMIGAALLVLAALAGAPAQTQSRPPDFDETVKAVKGGRLAVNTFAGEVVIRTWTRDAVRVQARHGRRTKVDVEPSGSNISVHAHQEAPSSVDYEITAPAWMPVRVVGTYAFISIEGAQSEVHAETTRGDVIVKGGSGVITAKSIQGNVLVEGAKGRITVSSVNEGVRIVGATGDVSAESNNGDITMTQMRSQNVEASTINGDISFEGPPADRGRYQFTTHNGSIRVDVPQSANVTFAVRSYQGSFSSSLELKGPPRSEVRQGRRTLYTLGSGSAEMELESFGGSIRIGPPPPPRDKSKK